jgi:hypothetical protein
MTRLPQPAIIWTANLLAPGAGLVLAGLVVWGAVTALLWGLLAAILVLQFVWPDMGDGKLLAVSVVGVALLFFLAQISLWGRLRGMRRYLAGGVRDEKFKAALVAYLQGRNDESEAICKELLRLDSDDVEATLQLAAVARRRGRLKVACRYLRRARYLDDEGRWDFQIGRELDALTASTEALLRS